MPKKPTLADKFMSEKIAYGGEIRTRASVAKEMKAQGFPARAIDRFAYATPTIEEDRKKHPQMFAETYKPENKRAKQHEGQPRRRKTTYGYKVGRRNEYNVSTYSRDGKYKYQNVNAWGQDSLRTAKRVGGQRANGRAYKNVVYNRTRKHYVGPNRAR